METALQALHQVAVKCCVDWCQPIEIPEPVSSGEREAGSTQVSQVSWGRRLRHLEDLHQVTHAELSIQQQVKNAEPGAIRFSRRGRQNMDNRTRVLILCTGNSARSQMAEGLLRHDGGDSFEVVSAGTKPTQVRPEAITVMRELGIDISSQRSKAVDEFGGRTFNYVITVCDNAKESCPIFPAKTKRIHWSIEDPAAVRGSEEQRLAAFRSIRDALRERLRGFVEHQTAE